jgi:hypothetical protein
MISDADDAQMLKGGEDGQYERCDESGAGARASEALSPYVTLICISSVKALKSSFKLFKFGCGFSINQFV